MAKKTATIFGLLANPVSHSLSPVLYRKWFLQCGMKNAKFELFDIAPEKLADFIKRIRNVRRDNLSGLAVSIPHKEAVMQYLDEIDPIAREIGAVNTIKWVSSAVSNRKKLKGWNTDWIGVLDVFREAKIDLHGKRVLILGAGGAARAVVYACMKESAHVVIANRTYEKAETLAADFRCSVIDWEDRESVKADVVINTTSAGLEDPGSSPVSQEFFENIFKAQPDGCVFDLVYRPRMTKFLKDAASAGAQIMTGDRMLYFQGIAQFNILTGKLNSRPTGKTKRKTLKISGGFGLR